jgi:hypothetical protein
MCHFIPPVDRQEVTHEWGVFECHVIKLLTSLQKGMWAMIGTSIALVIWTSGLLYMATDAEKKRVAEAQVGVGDKQNFEVDATGDAKV